MGLESCLTYSNRLSFLTWNGNGLLTMENSLQNNEFLSMINAFDFLILNETWSNSPDIDVEGFRFIV